MASVYSEIITKPQFIQITCSMLVLSSAFVVARVGLQVWKRKAMELQDYLLYAAYIFFLAMSVCFLVMIPRLFAIAQATAGIIELYPTMMDDVILYFRAMFASTTLFWLTLWSVKLSLLALYKKLMEGLPAMYKKLWWAVFVFCIVGLVGCVVSYTTSCPDFGKSLRTGDCPSSSRTVRGSLASLYTAYAVDILSDLMSKPVIAQSWPTNLMLSVMFLPIRLVWNLQMKLGKKIAIILLFASGFVCIAFATLRVVQVGSKAGGTTAPSPTWLALWTVIESSIVVIIGCCPAFAIFYRTTHTQAVSYDTNGYIRHNQSRSGTNSNHPGAINMNFIATGRRKSIRNDKYWDDTQSSQEELAADSKAIMVTTTLQQDHRQSDAKA